MSLVVQDNTAMTIRSNLKGILAAIEFLNGPFGTVPGQIPDLAQPPPKKNRRLGCGGEMLLSNLPRRPHIGLRS
jgi:hypothetical protein